MVIKVSYTTTQPIIRVTDASTNVVVKVVPPSPIYIKYGGDGSGGGASESALSLLQYVRNKSGSTIAKGSVVYISGATGNTPDITKAIATGDPTSAQTLGVVKDDISNNGFGYVVVFGKVSGLDTHSYTEGQQLYLSGTTAGSVTTTKPYAPIHLVYVAIVTRSHPNLGTWEVRVQNGYEMDEIHDVAAQNPSDGDVLQYVSSTGLWTKTLSINFGTW